MAPLTLIALPVVGILLIFTMPVIMTDLNELDTFLRDHYKFAIELYQEMRKDHKNVVVSPINIQIMLAITYTGAKGNTKVQMANVLHIPNNIEAVLEEHKRIIEYLQDPALNLKFVASVFFEKTLNVKQKFLGRVSQFFKSNVAFFNFKSNPEGSRQEINRWVEQRTDNKVKNFLDPGAVNKKTAKSHTNVVYFKEEWDSQFDETLPDSDFYITPDNKIKVTMMFQNEVFRFKHLPELKAKILELPYENKEFKMFIILPDEINGLSEIENKLSTLNLPETVRSFDKVSVDLTLPRFKIDKTTDIIKSLKRLGIKDLFDQNKCNLNGISDGMYDVSFDQKMFIEISETETVAAAASGYRYSRSKMHKEYFLADHPFIFFIYSNKVPLIIGNIYSYWK